MLAQAGLHLSSRSLSYSHQFVSSTLSSSASAFCCVHFHCFDVERVLGIPPNRRLVHGLAGARCIAGMMKVNENFLWTKTTLLCLISVGRKLMWLEFSVAYMMLEYLP
jgi:hypothetical protein